MSRYAIPKIKPLTNTPSPAPAAPAAHVAAHLDGVVIERPSILCHIAKVVGRKQLAKELGISKSMLDQMLSGEKNDIEWRVQRLVEVAVKACGPEIVLMIVEDLIGAIRRGAQK